MHEEPVTLRQGASHRFATFLVRRPVTVTMLFLTLMGAGLLAYSRIPLQLLPPGLSSSSLSIWMPYPGAGPSEVQEQIARPVEESLRTIPGITDISSFSSEGGCNVEVEFGSTVDMDVAYGEVRDRIERLRPRLPSEMDRYRVRRFNTNTDLPVMWIGVQYDDKARDPFQPIEKIAVPRLEGVDGVANVQINGFVDEAVRIFVDMEKVRGYGINLGEVIQQLQRDNFSLPAGQVDDGARTFQVRVDGRFHSEEEIRSYPIGGGRVLGDVADVVRARAYRDFVWRINGRPAVGMAISRESDENTIAVCERVERVIAGFADDPRLQGVTFNVFWNQKEDILKAVHGLRDSGLWGGLFAALVLFAFLRDVRLTLIAGLAMPASLLAALLAVHFGGGTLNLISLTGFTLGIGMLVDNAVVVIESIAVKRARGRGRIEACGEGAGEVGLAVLASTLTSVVVFVPLIFMDGDRNVKVMMREVGLPISWSLIASLLVALVFIPAFTARLMGRRTLGPAAGGIAVHSGPLLGRFRSALAWTLDHRFAACLLLAVVVGLSVQAGSALPKSEMGGGEMNAITVEVKAPSTYLLPDTNQVFRKLEAWAEAQVPRGIEFWSVRFDRFGGDLRLWAREDMPNSEFAKLDDRLRELLPQIPGVELTLGFDGASASKQVRVNVTGPDFPTLARIATDLKARLKGLELEGPDGARTPLLDNVRTDIEEGLDEIHVAVDRDRASDLGVLPETIRGVVAWGLSGQRLPDLVEGDDETRVQIEYAFGEEESVAVLMNLGLPRLQGGSVPLASVAGLDFEKSVGTLVRRNGRMTTGVTAAPAVENLYLVSAGIEQAVRSYPFPEGYGWNEEGGRQDFEADMAALMKTMALSITLIYLIMAILFESAILPLSILLSIPLAFMGVNIALWAADYPLDPMVVVGMILLAGIVVNNAIVMIDLVQRLRAEGLPRREALLRGSTERLRPILMTALTTICGLFPTAWPWMFPGAGQTSGYESMAVTVMGGLSFSTFFTLFVVPVFYTFFDDVGALLRRLAPWAPRPEAAPAGAAPAAVLEAHGAHER